MGQIPRGAARIADLQPSSEPRSQTRRPGSVPDAMASWRAACRDRATAFLQVSRGDSKTSVYPVPCRAGHRPRYRDVAQAILVQALNSLFSLVVAEISRLTRAGCSIIGARVDASFEGSKACGLPFLSVLYSSRL